MSFGKTLQQLRIKRGITQKEIAEKLGWKTSQLVSNFERDVCYPPLDSINELAEVLGCSESELKIAFIQAKTADLQAHLKNQLGLS